MKKYSKFVATFLALGMLLIVLSACGNEQSPTKSSNANGSTASEKDKEKAVNLTFAIWDNNQLAGMQQMADAYTAKNPNVKIAVNVTPWDQYWTKLEAGAVTGSMPDIFWMHPAKVFNFTNGNALLDLTDKIAADSIDMKGFSGTVVNSYQINNKQYAIPKDIGTEVLFYNKDIFDKAGVAYPDDTWTWDTWMQAAEKLTDKANGVYGMLAPPDTQDFVYSLIWQNGGDIISADGKKPTYTDQKVIDALKYGISFVQKGFSPTPANFVNTERYQYFETGKGAMLEAGSWMTGEFLGVKGLNVGVAPLPKGVQRGTLNSGMGYAAAASSPHAEEAWKFLSFLASKEANLIQAESGAAIPALSGTQEPWIKKFPNIDGKVFVDAAEYGFATQFTPTHDDWSTEETNYIVKMFSGESSVEDGVKAIQEAAEKAMK